MKRPTRCLNLATVVTALLLACLPALSGILVSDTFADGESITQEISNNSLQVFNGRSDNTRTDAVGSMSLALTNQSSEAVWVHFTSDADPSTAGGHNPVTLANDGDKLTVRAVFNVTFNPAITGNQDIRFGVGDSKGTRNTANLTGGQNNAVFADDSFYGGTLGITGTSTTTPFRITKRIATPGSPNNPFNATADALRLTINEGGSQERHTLVNGVDYTFTYTIQRVSATLMRMKLTLEGGTLPVPYEYTADDDGAAATAPGLNTTFDWLTLRTGGNVLAGFVVKKIEAETNFGGGGSPEYNAWVSGFGLDPATTGSGAGDPDGDGLPNSVENVLGLAPNVADAPAGGVPSVSLDFGQVTLRFTRSTTAVLPWTIQTTVNPGSAWQNAVNGQNGVVITTAPPVDNKEAVTVTLPAPVEGRLFARLKAG